MHCCDRHVAHLARRLFLLLRLFRYVMGQWSVYTTYRLPKTYGKNLSSAKRIASISSSIIIGYLASRAWSLRDAYAIGYSTLFSSIWLSTQPTAIVEASQLITK